MEHHEQKCAQFLSKQSRAIEGEREGRKKWKCIENKNHSDKIEWSTWQIEMQFIQLKAN